MTFKELNKLMQWKELPFYAQPFETLIKKGFQHFDPIEFEKFILKLFETLGFTGNLTPTTSDGGIDIIFNSQEGIVVVQCKKYDIETNIGVPEVREFFGAMNHYKAEIGYFITTTQFSEAAKEFAQEHNNLILIGQRALERLFRLAVENEYGRL